MALTLRSMSQGLEIQYQSASERARRQRKHEKLPPPEFGPAADLESLPVGMLVNRERLYAYALAHLKASRTAIDLSTLPLDTSALAVECVYVFWEAWVLTLAEFAKKNRRTPCLPGCDGDDGEGHACQNLRCFGERFCLECSNAEPSHVVTTKEARLAGLRMVKHRR